MAITVKICGLNSADAADAAARARADFGGLVFHAASPRHLSLEAGEALAGRLRGRLRLAALTVDADDAILSAIDARIAPDFFQLHGSEPPARVAAVRARFGRPVIKAIALADPSDFAGLAAYEAVADMLLFDARAPDNAARPGGHGAAFDWTLLTGRRIARPWLLAGGLDPDNVARAIALSGASGVDVSSGVERAPGIKDADRIVRFVANARGALVSS
jgi:phosphoribosylanthranilate isomerase